MTPQLHDTDNTTYATQHGQHDLPLSLKLTMKTFVEFPKFNWFYDLLCYTIHVTKHIFI